MSPPLIRKTIKKSLLSLSLFVICIINIHEIEILTSTWTNYEMRILIGRNMKELTRFKLLDINFIFSCERDRLLDQTSPVIKIIQSPPAGRELKILSRKHFTHFFFIRSQLSDPVSVDLR